MRKKPIKLITLDTETYNGLLGDLKRIAIFDGEQVRYGYTFSDIEPYLIDYFKQGYSVHVYIHNIEFDARKIPELFEKKRIVWEKSFIINNRFATIACKKYTIHDSYKLLPMSLGQLSKDFNVKHGKLSLYDAVRDTYGDEYNVYYDSGEVDENKTLVNFLDKCNVDDPLFLKYLGYDVLSLYEILQVIIDISGIEISDFVKRISTASLSRFIFKNGYKGHLFKNPLMSKSDYEILCQYKWHFDLETEEFIRCSYCGGRTEVFTPRLEDQGYHYDVNSLYPYCMKKEYPVGEPQFYSDSDIAKEYFENWMEDHNGLGFVSCTVFIPMQNIPPLPVKMGKLTFPCGIVFGTWTYTELEYAIKNCGVEIIEFREVCHFSQTYPVFKNFIETMVEIKNRGTIEKNPALRQFGKLLMNVGYGYTGMNRDKTQLRSIDDLNKFDQVDFIDEDLGYIEVPADVKSEYIQVQVASYVTSYARLILLDALRKADAVGQVFYCDTDSIICDHPFDDSIVDPVELGKWDLEREPKKGLFLRAKVYAEILPDGENLKFKGISKETQKTLSYDDYEVLFEELVSLKNDSKIIEKNKLQLRSIMYMLKNNIDFTHYEYRDKKMNFKTIEKREMNYAENKTSPHYFATEKDFVNFSYKRSRNVDINLLRG